METPVEVVVQFGKTQVSGRQLLSLQKGDILLLDTDVEDMLLAEVQGVKKYWGIPGTVKSNKAFQVIREEQTRF
jgi:flagellar motor switch protein FliM